jgi:hypothetical protein
MHYKHKRSYIVSTLAIAKEVTRFEQGDPSFFEIVVNNEYHFSISPFLKRISLRRYNHEEDKNNLLRGYISDCHLSGDTHLTYIKHAENVLNHLLQKATCELKDWDLQCWKEDITSPRCRA